MGAHPRPDRLRIVRIDALWRDEHGGRARAGGGAEQGAKVPRVADPVYDQVERGWDRGQRQIGKGEDPEDALRRDGVAKGSEDRTGDPPCPVSDTADQNAPGGAEVRLEVFAEDKGLGQRARCQRVVYRALALNDERPLLVPCPAPLERAYALEEGIVAAGNDLGRGSGPDGPGLGRWGRSYGSALRATSATSAKAASSRTAKSASIFRSTATPARVRPWMKRL